MKEHLVVLSGAGISAESGLKTFRDADGLWEGYDINEVATATAWRKNPTLVQEFYNLRRESVRAAKPNRAHILLAQLEEYFNVTVVTQNIDDLHERGGSTNVLHLHGEILKMRTVADEETIYEVKDKIEMGDLGPDGQQLRPHIVWFEEAVPMMDKAIEVVSTADIFLIIGTSLVVYPAAGLIHYAPSTAKKFVIDKSIPQGLSRITAINKTAVEGMEEFYKMMTMEAP